MPWHDGKGGKAGKGFYDDPRFPHAWQYGGKGGDGWDLAPEYGPDFCAGAAVPPPPELQHGYRRGGPYQMADGLLACNLPPELQNLTALHRHFRRFGEILKLTIHNGEGRAFVQFSDQGAAEAARMEPVPGCPGVDVRWVPRDREPRGRGRGRGKGRGDHGGAAADVVPQNRILVTDPEERRRLDESSRKREEINSKKLELQQQLTEQMKILMMKLQDKELGEERRESFRALLLKIKERLSSLTGGAPAASAAPTPSPAKRPPPDAGQKYTLDLRPRALRMNVPQDWALEKLQAALVERLGSAEHVENLEWEDSGGGSLQEKTAAVLFGSRWAAEQIFDQRSELTFHVEWCEDKTFAPATEPGAPTEGDAEPASADKEGGLGDADVGPGTATTGDGASAATGEATAAGETGRGKRPAADAEAEGEEEATWAEDASEHGDQDGHQG